MTRMCSYLLALTTCSVIMVLGNFFSLFPDVFLSNNTTVKDNVNKMCKGNICGRDIIIKLGENASLDFRRATD